MVSRKESIKINMEYDEWVSWKEIKNWICSFING